MQDGVGHQLRYQQPDDIHLKFVSVRQRLVDEGARPPHLDCLCRQVERKSST